MSKKVDAAVSASNPPSLCITELYYPDFLLPRTRRLGPAGFEWQLFSHVQNAPALPCPMFTIDRIYSALQPGYDITWQLLRSQNLCSIRVVGSEGGVYGATLANTASSVLLFCLHTRVHHDEKTCVTDLRNVRNRTEKRACCTR